MKETPKSHLVLALLGPSASGKTALSVKLAEKLNAEIIALDSTTPYRGFNIGTSKADPLTQKQVPHHLIDFLDPDDSLNAFDFVKKADEAISDIISRNKLPLIVGGTYFYLKGLQKGMYAIPPVEPAVVENIEKEFEETENTLELMHRELQKADPESAKTIHPNDRYRMLRALAIFRSTNKRASELTLAPPTPNRPPLVWVKYALLVSRHDLTQLITQRTDKMLTQGLIEETRLLQEAHPKAKALSSIGYAECVKFLNKEIDQKQLRNEIIEKTRQLAKRQMTWLRSDPEVRFIDSRDADRVILEISNLKFALNNQGASL